LDVAQVDDEISVTERDCDRERVGKDKQAGNVVLALESYNRVSAG
jgi:hypothetical protein